MTQRRRPFCKRLAVIILLSGLGILVTGGSRVSAIVGGEVTSDSFPWMVALVRADTAPLSSLICGGALIHSRWVLTSEHCVDPANPGAVEIVVGSNDINGGTRVGVERIVERTDQYSTLALVKLKVALSQTPIAIEGVSDNFSIAGQTALLLGWGLTSFPGLISTDLKELSSTVATASACKQALRDNNLIWQDSDYASAICFKSTDYTHSPCFGDSGGPVVVYSVRTPYLVGVLEWSFGGCGTVNAPSAGMRPKSEYQWINRAIGSTVIAPPLTTPVQPTDLTVEAIGTKRLALTWTDNATNEQGFVVERSTDSSTWTEIESEVGADVMTYDDYTVAHGTTYSYRVAAYNTAGQSAFSNIATARSRSLPAGPETPSVLGAIAVESNTIRLLWSRFTNASVLIFRSIDQTNWNPLAIVSGRSTEHIDTDNVQPATTYYYQVQSYSTESGLGPRSKTVSATTPAT